MQRASYSVTVRDESYAVLYSKTRRGTANALFNEMQRRFPAWWSIDVNIAVDVIRIHETRSPGDR